MQVFETNLKSAITTANQLLDSSDNGDRITADTIQSVANKLQETIAPLVSVRLPELNQLVVEASGLKSTLVEIKTKVRVEVTLNDVCLWLRVLTGPYI